MWYNYSYHSHVESAFLFLSKSRLSVRVPRDCGKHEKQQIGGSLIRGTMKKCSKCNNWKPFSDFYKNQKAKDGYMYWCKLCCKVGYEERHKLSQRKWRNANQERAREVSRNWRTRNLDKARQWCLQWEKNNPVKAAIRSMKRRAIKRQSEGAITFQEWESLKKKYNYTCLRCKRQEPEIKLTLDHIKPISQGGTNTIDNAQPLCGKCNSSKHNKFADYRE